MEERSLCQNKNHNSKFEISIKFEMANFTSENLYSLYFISQIIFKIYLKYEISCSRHCWIDVLDSKCANFLKQELFIWYQGFSITISISLFDLRSLIRRIMADRENHQGEGEHDPHILTSFHTICEGCIRDKLWCLQCPKCGTKYSSENDFIRGGSRITRRGWRWGTNVRFCQIFQKKRKEMHEIEKILDRREGGGYRPMFINTTQYMWRAPYEKL